MLKRLVILFACLAAPTWAHEFWIAPTAYEIAADEQIVAQLRVGEKFEGAVQRYFPGQITRFEVYGAGKVERPTARLGDDPALHHPAMGNGLIVVVHETTAARLTYRKPDKFPAFLTHKGRPDLIAEHQARGLPDVGFKEYYTRFAKSLIAAGDGVGADQSVGLRTEIVALKNPYTDALAEGLPVRISYEGKPRSSAFVEVFSRGPSGAVEVETYRTDADGIAVLSMRSATEYLVDAVMIRPLESSNLATEPVWESLWASLTFHTP